MKRALWALVGELRRIANEMAAERLRHERMERETKAYLRRLDEQFPPPAPTDGRYVR